MSTRDRRRLWRQFRRKWLADDGRSYEPPAAGSEVPLRLWADHSHPTHIVFFSKEVLLRRWLESGLWVPSRWLVLERMGFPEPAYLKRVADLYTSLRAPICFVGDLDPLDLSSFLAVRALHQDFITRRPALPVTWVGLSDPWLALCRRHLRPRASLPILDMKPLEQEHWKVLAQVAPEVRATIGPECAALLDRGKSLDVAGMSGIAAYGADFPQRLLAYLKNAVRRARPRR
jgi:hypothetical protein